MSDDLERIERSIKAAVALNEDNARKLREMAQLLAQIDRNLQTMRDEVRGMTALIKAQNKWWFLR